MPRRPGKGVGGIVYHVMNRAIFGHTLFESEGDYAAFERLAEEGHERDPIRILAYCVMPNHWHFVLWPERDGQLSDFLRRLTVTHTKRWQAHRRRHGTGHLYQGRFRSFPVQTDTYFLTVCRYVERNALQAGLVERAEDWRWGSLWRRERGGPQARSLLSAWPVEMPPDWLEMVNQPLTEKELEAVRRSIRKGCPLGSPAWQAEIAERLRLTSTLRPQGRPMKRA